MMDGQLMGDGGYGDAADRRRGGSDRAADGDDGPGQSRRRAATRLVQSLIERLWRGARSRQAGSATADAGEAAAASREEEALLHNIKKLRDVRVDDVMVPRADIVAVELNSSLPETLEAFRIGAHSRLPVYRETLDYPIGVVHLKDLALSHGFGAGEDSFSLAEHLRGALFVPPSMRVQALMQRMQASRRHMALVIDEYGGVDGLVTIEDVIEQIVGDIEDEHDDASRPLWRRESDGVYLVEARALIEDFEGATQAPLAMEDWEEDVDTLGGMIFMLIGRVPERGEVIPHPLGHEFEILDADARRIKRLRVRLRQDSPPTPTLGDAADQDAADQEDARQEDARQEDARQEDAGDAADRTAPDADAAEPVGGMEDGQARRGGQASYEPAVAGSNTPLDGADAGANDIASQEEPSPGDARGAAAAAGLEAASGGDAAWEPKGERPRRINGVNGAHPAPSTASADPSISPPRST